ncbi:MAG: hypothetical protein WC346_15190 [Methanogenium sp.]|jgi:hypothetical protein
MNKITDVYEAFWFLHDHSEFYNPQMMANYPKDADMWSGFNKCFEWSYQKINPMTGCIDKDSHKNTKTQVWIECGAYMKICSKYYPSHDVKLDCGGDTFEEALITLANLVLKHYGNGKKLR